MITNKSLVRPLLGVATAALAIVLWWVLSSGSTSPYFPPLKSILSAFRSTWGASHLESDALPSLERLACGFVLACVVGVGLGTVLGLSSRLRRNTEPILEFLRAVPPPTMIPAAMALFGLGPSMKVGVIAIGSLWPVLLSTIDGVRSVEEAKIEASKVFQLSPLDRLRRVILPSASPQIFGGMRTCLSISIILMVISEMVASTDGIGYFVIESQRTFAMTAMWTGIILLGVLGYVLNVLFTLVEKRALRWHRGLRRIGD